jgi:hypothetical protein
VDIGDDETPAAVGDLQLGGTASQITTGKTHSCALLDSGELVCWGLGSSGELGRAGTQSIGDDEAPALDSLSVAVADDEDGLSRLSLEIRAETDATSVDAAFAASARVLQAAGLPNSRSRR